METEDLNFSSPLFLSLLRSNQKTLCCLIIALRISVEISAVNAAFSLMLLAVEKFSIFAAPLRLV